MKKIYTAVLATGLAAAITACSSSNNSSAPVRQVDDATATTALTAYADWVLDAYEESLDKAEELQTAIGTLTATPTAGNLTAAKEAYADARVPYQQTEAARFDADFVGQGVTSVDDQEGQINAWPLDEGLIDYVDGNYSAEDENTLADGGVGDADIVAGTNNAAVNTNCGVDVSTIDQADLPALNECGGFEANVATGVHAIEFLLWGQDTNGTGAGAGARTHTDFDTSGGACTSGTGNTVADAVCQRRADYIEAAAQQLVDDLTALRDDWSNGGDLRNDLLNGDIDNSLNRVLFGWGSLALGELASERMSVALNASSPEDEHDCFSDLTHVALFNNAKAVENVYTGDYTPAGGVGTPRTGLNELIASVDPVLGTRMDTEIAAVISAMQAISDQAEDGPDGTPGNGDELAFDQQIANGPGAPEAALIEAAVDALVAFTDSIEEAARDVFGIANLAADGGSVFSQGS